MTTPPACYVGIDVAKATLAVATATHILCEVANTPAGHKKLIDRLRKLSVLGVVVEATGIYGHDLMAALMAAGFRVAMVQPGCVRHFAQSQKIHAKTDAIDAKVIARFAESRSLRFLEKTPESIAQLRALVDRRDQLIAMRVSEENHLEANRNELVRKEIKAAITRLARQEAAYNKRIAALMQENDDLNRKRKLLEDHPGVGLQTAAVLMAHLPELGAVNRQQIAALVGLAPYNHDSGTMRARRSIYGGRCRLRKALYLAAITAVKWDESLKAYYVALRTNGKPAKVALIACARKLIVRLNSILAATHKEPQEAMLAQ